MLRLIAVVDHQRRELDRIRAAAASDSVVAMARGALMERLGLSSAEAASQLSGTLNGWQDKYPGVRVRQNVVNGHPDVVLSGYSACADLVVLGGHGGSSATVHGTGSIQHMVLNHAFGPVVVIPSDS